MSHDINNKYLASVVRMFISGNYGSERSKSLLQKKAEALGLPFDKASELEEEKITKLTQALSYLKELCEDTDELDDITQEEFTEYCQDINLSKEEIDLLIKNFQAINIDENDETDEIDESDTTLAPDTHLPRIKYHEKEYVSWNIDEYVIKIDKNYMIDNYIVKFDQVLGKSCEEFKENFLKFNSISELKNGVLINLFFEMMKDPINSLCKRAIELKRFDVDENAIVNQMSEALYELKEIENNITAIQQDINIALQEQNMSSHSTTMAVGSLGFMVGAAAISGVSKVFSGIGNSIKEHQYRSEIEKRAFLALAPRLDEIRNKITINLISAYNIIHSSGTSFQELQNRIQNSMAVANNLDKVVLAKDEKIYHILNELQKFAYNCALWIQLADCFEDLSKRNEIINIAKQCDKYDEDIYDLYMAKLENTTLIVPYEIFNDDLENISASTCCKVKKLLMAIDYQINNNDFQGLLEGYNLLKYIMNALNFDFDKYETFLYTLQIIATNNDNYLLYKTLIDNQLDDNKFNTDYDFSIFKIDKTLQKEIKNKIKTLAKNIPDKIKGLLYQDAEEDDENFDENAYEEFLQKNYKIFADIDKNYLNLKDKQNLLKELIEEHPDIEEYKRYYALASAENNDFQTAIEYSDFITNQELTNDYFENLQTYISEAHAHSYNFIENCKKFQKYSFYDALMKNEELDQNKRVNICNFIFLHEFYQTGQTASTFIYQNELQDIPASILSLLIFFEPSELNDQLGIIQLLNVFHVNDFQEIFNSSQYKEKFPDYSPITDEAYFTLLKEDLANITINSLDNTFDSLHDFFFIMNNNGEKESIERIDNLIPQLPKTKIQLLICKIQLLQNTDEGISILKDLLLQGITFNYMKVLCPHIDFNELYEQTVSKLITKIKKSLSININKIINNIKSLELNSLLYIFHNKLDRVNNYIKDINNINFDENEYKHNFSLQNTDIISYLISSDSAILLTLSHIYYFEKDTVERIPYNTITEVKESGFFSTYVKLYFQNAPYKELKVTNVFLGAGVNDFIDVIRELINFWRFLHNNYDNIYHFISINSLAPEIFSLKDYPHQLLEFNKLSRNERQN